MRYDLLFLLPMFSQQFKLVRCLMCVTWKSLPKKQSDVGRNELDDLIVQKALIIRNIHTKIHPQALTQVSIKVHVSIQTNKLIYSLQSVCAYTTLTHKIPFMPKVSAPEKHKHVNSRLIRLISTNTWPSAQKQRGCSCLPKNTKRSTLSVNSLCGAWASGYRYLPAPVPRWRGSVS